MSQPQPTRHNIEASFRQLQIDICNGLQSMDGIGLFSIEPWSHNESGGGITRVMTNGQIIEKGGVNFSAVGGLMPGFMKEGHGITDAEFFATGVSIVLHPHNPFVPIIHMNVRYFETSGGTCWFGGGIDLTPHYVIAEDAGAFHRKLKAVCDRFSPVYYTQFKAWADDYFFIPHRKETRGIGGIFFDHLKPADDNDKARLLYFVLAVGNSFLDCYVPLALKYANHPFSPENKQWQYLRRGRYAEFNLVYDRGTRFGLETSGRTESILMSLPPMAAWQYDHHPITDSPEHETLNLLRKGVNWAEEH